MTDPVGETETERVKIKTIRKKEMEDWIEENGVRLTDSVT